MRRVFAVDVLVCPRCGSRLRAIATVLDAPAVQTILAHLARSRAARPRPTRARRHSGHRVNPSYCAFEGPGPAPLVNYRSFQYRAASRARPRRVIAKVEHHLGELFPRVGFIVTTLSGPNRAVVPFYNQRGTAEQWIKEGKEATYWTRLSYHRLRGNEVRLLLGVIADNPGNLLRRLVLPLAIRNWRLTSLQQRLFKTGGRLIRHARYFVLQLAESSLTRRLFRRILGRIE